MKNATVLPLAISVIYFHDNSKNIYAKLPPDKEQAKRLSMRVYKDVMTALSAPKTSDEPLALTCD